MPLDGIADDHGRSVVAVPDGGGTLLFVPKHALATMNDLYAHFGNAPFTSTHTSTAHAMGVLSRDANARTKLRAVLTYHHLIGPTMSDAALLAFVSHELDRRALSRIAVLSLPPNTLSQPLRPNPGDLPKVEKPPAGKPVSQMSVGERIAAMFARSQIYLAGEAGRKALEIVKALASPETVALLLACLIFLAAAQAAGVGELADAALLAWAYATLGWSGLCAMWRVLGALVDAATAGSEEEIDQAARKFTHNLVALGADAIGIFLTWAARRIGRSRSADKPPEEPSSEQPSNRTPENPRTRLPRTNGHWDGEPGESGWHSDNPAVNRITNGEPVQFRNGRPDFSPWSQGEITFKDGVLDGSRSDFSRVYDYLKNENDLSSQAEAQDLLRDEGLTPHHLDANTIQLIPSDLHNNIPHIGAASDLRGGP